MKGPVLMGLLLCGMSQLALANANFLSEQLAKKSARYDRKALPQLETRSPFFKDHRLVLFFESSCAYCQRFAPIVKRWASVHGAPVLALSFDSQPLASFPDAHLATPEWIHVAFAGKPITYPALFVANKKHSLLYPLVFGAMGYDAFDSRFNQMKSKIEAYEAGRRVV